MTMNNCENDKTARPRTVLSLDTSMNGCSVSLYDAKEQTFVQKTEQMSRGQAEALMPMVLDVSRESGVPLKDIDRFAVTIGPGAFTGVRIGLSAAKTLSFAAGKPLCGFSTLEVIAAKRISEKDNVPETVAVILESKRKDFYIQLFDQKGLPLTEPDALNIEEITTVLDKAGHGELIGDGVTRFLNETKDLFSKNWFAEDMLYNLPDTNCLAELAFHYDAGFKEIHPLYLREADVSKSKKKFRVLNK